MTIEIAELISAFEIYTAGRFRYLAPLVSSNNSAPGRVIIFADETADWKIAGLRQVDRLALALDEFLGESGNSGTIPLTILPAPGSSVTPVLSVAGRLSKLRILQNFSPAEPVARTLVLSTHLVGGRRTFARLGNGLPVLSLDTPIGDARDSLFAHLLALEKQARLSSNDIQKKSWCYLESKDEISRCEEYLLAQTDKTQDGVIARYLNRPISQAISRLLLRFPIVPNHFTIALLLLPLAGALCFLRGDYLGFALGALLFQAHSVLDGCDGEIARVKYLESPVGAQLDGICDRLSSLIFIASLGFGLAHHFRNAAPPHWPYALEGIVAAAVIGIVETWLTRAPLEEVVRDGDSRLQSFVTEQAGRINQGDQMKFWAIERSGLLSLGENAAGWFSALTKRDVFNFAFMVLLLCNLPRVVLHIAALAALAISVFGLKDFLAPLLAPRRSASLTR